MHSSKLTLIIGLFFSLILYTKTLAAGEVCPAGNNSCCVPPPSLAAGCPTGKVWIGPASSGGCRTPASCPTQQFSCSTNACVAAPSGTAPVCRSDQIHVGNNVCKDLVQIIVDSSYYKLWRGVVLSRLVSVSDSDCATGQSPVWNNTTKVWACGMPDSQWITSGTNIYNSNTGNVGIGASSPGAKLEVAGDVKWGTAGSGLYTDQGGNIELRGSSKTPYIDFSNDTTSDNDARIILDGNDSLTISGATVNVSGNLKIGSFYFDGNDDSWLRLRDGDNGNYKDLAVNNIWSNGTAQGPAFNSLGALKATNVYVKKSTDADGSSSGGQSGDWWVLSQAWCNSGDVAVGGGCEDSGAAGDRWNLYTNYPYVIDNPPGRQDFGKPVGWVCRGQRTNTSGIRALYAYATCVETIY